MLLLLALGSAHDFVRGGGEHPPRESRVAVAAGEAPPPPDSHPARAATTTIVDLNRADSLALDGLPGIGPVLTSRILAHRRSNGPFRAPEELLGVRGVGPALYAKLKGRIAVGPPVQTSGDSGSRGR